jgi:hypothetical protein
MRGKTVCQLLVKCSDPGLVAFLVADAFGLLTMLGRRAGATVAADDYTRRRLGLIETCGEGFLRINLDGTGDSCCFPAYEYRDTRR